MVRWGLTFWKQSVPLPPRLETAFQKRPHRSGLENLTRLRGPRVNPRMIYKCIHDNREMRCLVGLKGQADSRELSSGDGLGALD